MDETDVARTIAAAGAQRLEIPGGFAGWFAFAHTLNGYDIAEELEPGNDDALAELYTRLHDAYEATGVWSGSRLELRLTLFFEARSRRFNDAPGYNPDHNPAYRKKITDVLEAIRDKTQSVRNR